MKEILKLIEKTEIIIQNKKKKISKLYERLRKNVITEFIIILKEIENKEKISENNIDKKIKLKL